MNDVDRPNVFTAHSLRCVGLDEEVPANAANDALFVITDSGAVISIRACGALGIDADGHCLRCGLVAANLTEDTETECLPGFLTHSRAGAGGGG